MNNPAIASHVLLGLVFQKKAFMIKLTHEQVFKYKCTINQMNCQYFRGAFFRIVVEAHWHSKIQLIHCIQRMPLVLFLSIRGAVLFHRELLHYCRNKRDPWTIITISIAVSFRRYTIR